MKITELLVESRSDQETVKKMFLDFFPLAMEILGLDKLPDIKFEPTLNTGTQPSFGMYVNGEEVLYVALKGRHPNDILRTVAHELVHYKQDRLGQLNDTSGETGSPHENQANEVAGVIMRHFNKRYPQYLSSRPL
jgi:hypothetical protein